MSIMNHGWYRACVLVAIALAAVLLAGCADVSDDAYERIQMGMEIRDVQNIMGTDGKREERQPMSISAGGLVGTRPTAQREILYIWKSGGREITVTTRDGIVVDKNKRGF
jgi:hypothetical protein